VLLVPVVDQAEILFAVAVVALVPSRKSLTAQVVAAEAPKDRVSSEAAQTNLVEVMIDEIFMSCTLRKGLIRIIWLEAKIAPNCKNLI
jgi:hypothetical protein